MLQLFLFEGSAAWDAFSEAAARIGPGDRPTVHAIAPAAPANPRQRWALSADERAVFIELLLAFPGGRYATWMRQALQARRHLPHASRPYAYQRLSAPSSSRPRRGCQPGSGPRSGPAPVQPGAAAFID